MNGNQFVVNVNIPQSEKFTDSSGEKIDCPSD
jgi:hypothetical protein